MKGNMLILGFVVMIVVLIILLVFFGLIHIDGVSVPKVTIGGG